MARVPAPASTPAFTARGLLAIIRKQGGRIYRMREIAVFVITDNRELAERLLKLGGIRYSPPNLNAKRPDGSYLRARDGRPEWDIYIHTIPVKGVMSIYDAAAGDEQVYRAEDVA